MCIAFKSYSLSFSPVASECKQPIGIQTGFLEDRDIKTSSAKNFTSHGAWCAGTNNDKQFYAVDLGEDFLLTKIATQGKVDNKDRYVKSYELQYSSDNKKWNSYLSDGKQVNNLLNNGYKQYSSYNKKWHSYFLVGKHLGGGVHNILLVQVCAAHILIALYYNIQCK